MKLSAMDCKRKATSSSKSVLMLKQRATHSNTITPMEPKSACRDNAVAIMGWNEDNGQQ